MISAEYQHVANCVRVLSDRQRLAVALLVNLVDHVRSIRNRFVLPALGKEASIGLLLEVRTSLKIVPV